MHLPEDGGTVAGLLELPGESWFIECERRAEHGDSRGVRQLSGEERLARRRANRGVAMVSAETNAFPRKPVDVGGERQAVAVAAHDVTGVIVSEDEQEIRPAGFGKGQGRRGHGSDGGPPGRLAVIAH